MSRVLATEIKPGSSPETQAILARVRETTCQLTRAGCLRSDCNFPKTACKATDGD